MMKDNSLQGDKAKETLAYRRELIAKEKAAFSAVAETAILVFYVGEKQKYAMPYAAIDKVIAAQKITSIPGLSSLFSGLIYHNAEIWPVINLKILLGCQQTDTANNLILLHEDKHQYALSIGAIVGQESFDESMLQPGFSAEEEGTPSYISGIYQTDIALLDINAIFKILHTTQIA
ncbi:MAG: chemotaxis protein CheW [Silvanigrellaceae bacterium]|nr:chemotaxis protein CheW [Silvanigrellaceae bacterium]